MKTQMTRDNRGMAMSEQTAMKSAPASLAALASLKGQVNREIAEPGSGASARAKNKASATRENARDTGFDGFLKTFLGHDGKKGAASSSASSSSSPSSSSDAAMRANIQRGHGKAGKSGNNGKNGNNGRNAPCPDPERTAERLDATERSALRRSLEKTVPAERNGQANPALRPGQAAKKPAVRPSSRDIIRPVEDGSAASVNAPAGAGHAQPALPAREEKTALTTAPAEVTSDAPSHVQADIPSHGVNDAPSGVINDAPSGVINDAPSGVINDAPSGVINDAPSGVPSDIPTDVAVDAAGETASAIIREASSEVPIEPAAGTPAESQSEIPPEDMIESAEGEGTFPPEVAAAATEAAELIWNLLYGPAGEGEDALPGDAAPDVLAQLTELLDARADASGSGNGGIPSRTGSSGLSGLTSGILPAGMETANVSAEMNSAAALSALDDMLDGLPREALEQALADVAGERGLPGADKGDLFDAIAKALGAEVIETSESNAPISGNTLLAMLSQNGAARLAVPTEAAETTETAESAETVETAEAAEAAPLEGAAPEHTKLTGSPETVNTDEAALGESDTAETAKMPEEVNVPEAEAGDEAEGDVAAEQLMEPSTDAPEAVDPQETDSLDGTAGDSAETPAEATAKTAATPKTKHTPEETGAEKPADVEAEVEVETEIKVEAEALPEDEPDAPEMPEAADRQAAVKAKENAVSGAEDTNKTVNKNTVQPEEKGSSSAAPEIRETPKTPERETLKEADSPEAETADQPKAKIAVEEEADASAERLEGEGEAEVKIEAEAEMPAGKSDKPGTPSVTADESKAAKSEVLARTDAKPETPVKATEEAATREDEVKGAAEGEVKAETEPEARTAAESSSPERAAGKQTIAEKPEMTVKPEIAEADSLPESAEAAESAKTETVKDDEPMLDDMPVESPETYETAEPAEQAETTETAEASDMPEAADIHETVDAPEAPEAAEKPAASATEPVRQNPAAGAAKNAAATADKNAVTALFAEFLKEKNEKSPAGNVDNSDAADATPEDAVTEDTLAEFADWLQENGEASTLKYVTENRQVAAQTLRAVFTTNANAGSSSSSAEIDADAADEKEISDAEVELEDALHSSKSEGGKTAGAAKNGVPVNNAALLNQSTTAAAPGATAGTPAEGGVALPGSSLATTAAQSGSAAPASQQAAPGTAMFEQIENIQRLADAMKMANRNGVKNLTMQLSPPELGKVMLKVESRNGVVNAFLRVEKPEAVQQLGGNLAQLRENLKAVGIELGELDIRQHQQGQAAGDFSGQRQRKNQETDPDGRNHHSRQQGRNGTDEEDAAAPAMQSTGQRTRAGGLNFFA